MFVCFCGLHFSSLSSKGFAAVPLKCDESCDFVGPDRVCQTFLWRCDLRYNCAYCTEEEKKQNNERWRKKTLNVWLLLKWPRSKRSWDSEFAPVVCGRLRPEYYWCLTDSWLICFPLTFESMQNLSFSLCLSRRPTPDCLHACLHVNAYTHT